MHLHHFTVILHVVPKVICFLCFDWSIVYMQPTKTPLLVVNIKFPVKGREQELREPHSRPNHDSLSGVLSRNLAYENNLD